MGKEKKSTKLFKKKHLTREIQQRRNKPKNNQRKTKEPGTVSDYTQRREQRIVPQEPLKFTKEDEEYKEDNVLAQLDADEDSSDAEMEFENDEEAKVEDDEDDGDMDDDEDDDEDETAELTEKKDKLLQENAGHSKQLERLKAADPEFYSYLKENDADLLDFDMDSGSDGEKGDKEDGEEDDDEAAEEDAARREMEAGGASGMEGLQSSRPVVTKKMLGAWSTSISKEHSLTALRKVVSAFAVACRLGDEEASQEGRYSIQSGVVFNNLVRVSLTDVIECFDHHLPIHPGKPGKGSPLPSTSKKWSKMKTIVKSFISSLLHLLRQLSDPAMLAYTLHKSLAAAPYVSCFPKFCRQILKMTLEMWASREESVRVMAFMNIRTMAITAPHPFIDIALKGIYLTYVRNAKFTTSSNLATVTFMRNSVVELFALDPIASYQHAFVYIRQMAIHLRNAIASHNKTAVQQVYNWQFVHCIHVWCQALVSEIEGVKEGLADLVYPVVQIGLGVIRLIPTARYFPLRFQCIRALLKLAEGTKTYIPLLVYILDPLDAAEMKNKPKPSTDKPLEFKHMIKVSKGKIQTRQFQDAVMGQVYELCLQFFHVYSHSIAFPELCFAGAAKLRMLLRDCKVPPFRTKIKQLLDRINENSKYISGLRANVAFSPKDATAVKKFEQEILQSGQAPAAKFWKTWSALAEKKERETTKDVDVNQEDDSEGENEDTAKTTSKKQKKQKQVEQKQPKQHKKTKTIEDVAAPSNTEEHSDEGDEDMGDIVADFEFSDSDSD